MKLYYKNSPGWKYFEKKDLKVACQGDVEIIENSIDYIKKEDLPGLSHYLSGANGHFAGIIETGKLVIAFVDHSRTIPVFYSDHIVSNQSTVVEGSSQNKLLYESCLEFIMAGYCLSSSTLYENHYQLSASELLVFNKAQDECEVSEYYCFNESEVSMDSVDVLIEELAEIFDEVIGDVIRRANGHQIWIPLSAGLDSRLLISQFRRNGYDNLQSFSYGRYGNEAKYARKIAAKLDVKWRFIPTTWRQAQTFHHTEARKEYWKYASSYSCTPNMQDMLPLSRMLKDNIIKEGAFVINGQSGDFITGGHIPEFLLSGEDDKNQLYLYILNKHFSLWRNYRNEKYDRIISQGLDSLLNHRKGDLWRSYEYWEFKERQTKFVINGQRIYDFLGMNWQLPFWDQRLLRFWSKIPANFKIGQSLYIEYLRRSNYKGVFDSLRPKMPVYTGFPRLFFPLIRLSEFVLGNRRMRELLNNFHFFDRYNYQYAPYNYNQYSDYSRFIRNSISLQVLSWMRETLKLDISDESIFSSKIV